MLVLEQQSRYNINTRCKEAIVHSVLDCQHDIKDHIKTIQIYQKHFNTNTFLPKAQSLGTNTEFVVQTLENIAFNSLLATLLLSFESTQAKLNRTIKIILAHSEEIPRSEIPTPLPTSSSQGTVSFIQDRLFLLPLQVEKISDPKTTFNHLINSSEYTPDNEDYSHCFDLSNCFYATEPFVYIHHSESIHDGIVPKYKSPFKAPQELNKFYCHLPPPSDVPAYIPHKGHAINREGNPFYKKLQ